MKFIKYTECPISINGESFFATKAGLSSTASLTDNIVEGGSLEGYSPDGPLGAAVDFEYYVTGSNDSILSLTGNLPCSGSFGGIKFSGAYLTQYSININPYLPVLVNATFDIFSGYSSSLSSSSLESSSIDIANGAKTELLNIDSVNIGMDNPVSISHSITCERVADHTIGSEYASSVRLGAVVRNINLNGENIGALISYSGRDFAQISIAPKTINNLSRGQTIFCSGIITDQKLDVSADGTAAGAISITERIR